MFFTGFNPLACFGVFIRFYKSDLRVRFKILSNFMNKYLKESPGGAVSLRYADPEKLM